MPSYVGIDIGKAEVVVHLLLKEQPHNSKASFSNDLRGFEDLYKWLQQRCELGCVKAVVEATGVYWQGCAHYLHAQHLQVSVVNPAQVKFFARSMLRRGKTDGLDAELLAHFAKAMQPQPWHPLSEDLEHLKLLLREREDLLKMLTQEKNRLHAHKHRQGIPESLLHLTSVRIQLLKTQLKELEKALGEQLQKGEQRRNYELLVSLPGVSLITSATLIAETSGFQAFVHPRQLAAYAGIAPAPNQSGTFQGRSPISKIGNARIRRAMYLAAVAVTRTKTPLRAFYERLLTRGKPKKVALTALARKLLTIAFALIATQTPYDPDFSPQRPIQGQGLTIHT